MNSDVDFSPNNYNIERIGESQLQMSSLAVASGLSSRAVVTAPGVYDFTEAGVSIDFGGNPNGEIVVSKIMGDGVVGQTPDEVFENYEDAYWLIRNYGANNTLLDADITFHSDFVETNNADDYQLAHRSTISTLGWNNEGAATTASANESKVTFSGIDGFSQFVLMRDASAILPAELIDFKARLTSENLVELNWRTASEEHVSHFEIEHSLNSFDWKLLSIEAATNQASNYIKYDRNPYVGLNYYRLKTVDLDGSIDYSSIVNIRNDQGMIGVEIFPNPAADEVNVVREIGIQQSFEIMDSRGTVVQKGMLGDRSEKIVLKDLPSGVYSIAIKDGARWKVQKLIIGK